MQKSVGDSSGGRVNLRDVAAAVGVSKSTVSRILDERLPRSESVTAIQVRKVAADLGYVRDVSAASLRRGKTNTIGVIVPRLTDIVMAMFYEAVAQAAHKIGQFAIVATTDDLPGSIQIAADALRHRGVDGLIFTTARENGSSLERIASQQLPYVLALRTDGVSPSSVGDDFLGGYLATRHLIDLGHVCIGLIAGPSYASSARLRGEGFRNAMEEAGLRIEPEWIARSTFGIESGAEAAKKLMQLDCRPTAIFAVNDYTAIGAMSAIQRMGLSVPQDVSLVGYNDIPLVSMLPNPLTTVRVPFDRIAQEALDLLANGKDAVAPLRHANPTLIPRKSSARLI
jgi:LacI family transcriptional regulator